MVQGGRRGKNKGIDHDPFRPQERDAGRIGDCRGCAGRGRDGAAVQGSVR